MARIVVAGYSIRHPLAGNLIAILHHLLGLHLLGHEVFYVEESGWERSCYDPGAQDTPTNRVRECTLSGRYSIGTVPMFPSAM